MEQIIYLEVDDDILVVRDRMRRAQSRSVLLVVPAGCKAFERALDLRLLRRQAAALGQSIALVSGSAGLTDLASEEGIVVLPSLAIGRRLARRRARWRTVDKPGFEGLVARLTQRAHRWWYWVVGPIVVTLVLAVLAWSAVMIVPSATVRVTQAREPIGVSVWVEASMGVRAVAWDQMVMPARVVQVEVVDRGEIATTGIANVPAEKATGSVLFVNATAREMRIPVDTIVSTSAGTPVRFRTTELAVVAARGRVRVPIEALEGGPGGNVPANRINRVEGGLAASLKVTNESGTYGGTSDQVHRVTHGDKQTLTDLLTEQLVRKAHAEISALLEGEFLPIETMQVNPYSIRTNFDRHVDEQSDTLALEMRGVVWGLALSEELAKEITYRALTRQVRSGFHLLPDTVQISLGGLWEVEPDTGNVRFTMDGVALMEADLDIPLIQEAIRGKPIEAAAAYLRDTLPAESEPALLVKPTWMKRVPWMPFRIAVVKEDAEKTALVLPGS
ncbi:MAG: baseplate J/gp47 family protein [Anaerolineae bacterium]|nr:baseplate J/gp47 family protein [Anaerolineae bacterium]